ncbi:MAG: hypothetical protein M1821_004433 [Bathelium mastoideum]|nr:MAG: hypothetical protein M1821_004433 [Bathelium mastoideum]
MVLDVPTPPHFFLMRLRKTPVRLSRVFEESTNRYTPLILRSWQTGHAINEQQVDLNNIEASPKLEFRDGKPRPVYSRQHGNPDLPLPPFMDPSIKAQKERHKTPKPRADPQKRTRFQQKLYDNPYAQALATPVRICNVTEVHLPSYFHLEFHDLLPPQLPPDPDDSPSSPSTAAAAPPSWPPPSPKSSSSRSMSRSRSSSSSSTPWLLPLRLSRTAHPPSHPAHTTGPAARCLARLNLLRHLSGISARQIRLRGRLRFGDARVWREDMAALIARLLAETVETKLAWGLKHGGKAAVKAIGGETWGEWVEGVQEVKEVGCVVVVGSLGSARARDVERRWKEVGAEVLELAEDVVEVTGGIAERRIKLGSIGGSMRRPGGPRVNIKAWYPPLELPTITCRGKEVPVYTLSDMLGHEKAHSLVEGTAFKGAKCIILKNSYLTRAAQMWCSKLQAYLADDFRL